jgi:hypothetical protein
MTAAAPRSCRARRSGDRGWRIATMLVSLVVALALGVRLVSPVAAEATSGSGGRPVVLAVWAQVDGTEPLARASIKVYAGVHGDRTRSSALRERNGARQRLTYRSGVALLEFRRLPRLFTVEVTSGSVHGHRLRGSFRALVRDYRSGTIVYVNPVTTLIANDVAGSTHPDRRSTAGTARRQVYRLLAVPG